MSEHEKKPITSTYHPADALFHLWQVGFEGNWTRHEKYRILNIFQRLVEQTGGKSIRELFNGQPIKLHRSGRPGRVGRTRGGEIFLDDDWTDWTFAHELGHRWNNAWNRRPEKRLRQVVGAGKLEWLKRGLRRVEKSLERILRHLGYNGRLDWRALWYHPGKAPPTCGVDRNFNPGEDLAESFAATIFQQDAQKRARRAAERIGRLGERWNWPAQFNHFSATPRGQSMLELLRNLSTQEEHVQQSE